MASTIPVVRSPRSALPGVPRAPRAKLPRTPKEPRSNFASPTGGTHAFGTPGGRGSPQATTSVPKAKTPKASSPSEPRVIRSYSQPTTTASPTVSSSTPVNTTPNPNSPPTQGTTGGTPYVPPSAPSGPAPGAPGGAPIGAPDAGMPNTTIGVTPTAEGIALRNEAQSGWGTAQTQYAQDVANAALNYGVGSAGAINPNSALAIAALKAKQGMQTATNNRGVAKTIESSLYGQDRTRIGEAQSREDLLAYQKYQLAMQKYNDALVKAREAYEEGESKGNLADIQGAERRLPEPGVIEKGPKAASAKGPKTKGPKATKQSSQKITSAKNISVKKLGKVPKAKVK